MHLDPADRPGDPQRSAGQATSLALRFRTVNCGQLYPRYEVIERILRPARFLVTALTLMASARIGLAQTTPRRQAADSNARLTYHFQRPTQSALAIAKGGLGTLDGELVSVDLWRGDTVAQITARVRDATWATNPEVIGQARSGEIAFGSVRTYLRDDPRFRILVHPTLCRGCDGDLEVVFLRYSDRDGYLVSDSRRIMPSHNDTEPSTLVTLPFTTRIRVPWTWTSPDPIIGAAIRAKRSAVDASSVLPNGDGIWLVLKPASPQDGEASFILTLMPTHVGQGRLAEMSWPEIAEAERLEFRPEAERAATNTGRKITSWQGTTREEIGGRHGLLTRYSFTRSDGPPLRKETHAVYLGTQAIIAHVHLPAAAGSRAETALRQMMKSLRIGVDSL